MASRGRSAKQKGSKFELDIAKLLQEATGLEFVRGLNQSRGGGAETSDVICLSLPTVHFECKHQGRVSIKSAVEQAVNDTKKNNKLPIVITRDDYSDILVTMRIQDWLPFFLNQIDKLKTNV